MCSDIHVLFYHCRKPPIQQQAVDLVRDLMAHHDFDIRYTDISRKARVASLYLPLLSVVMDSWQWIYKGTDSSDSWPVFSQFGISVSEPEGNTVIQSSGAARAQTTTDSPQVAGGTGTSKVRLHMVIYGLILYVFCTRTSQSNRWPLQRS